MANIGTLKKRGAIALAVPSGDWEERHRTTSWDEADTFRTAIINNTQRSARVRYVAPNYIVEWRA